MSQATPKPAKDTTVAEAPQSAGNAWGDRLRALKNVPPVLHFVWESGPHIVFWNITIRILVSFLPVGIGVIGRYIIDGSKVNDNVKVFAGGLLVALLAIAIELVLALVQRWLTSPGLRRERRATMADAVMSRIPGIDQPAL